MQDMQETKTAQEQLQLPLDQWLLDPTVLENQRDDLKTCLTVLDGYGISTTKQLLMFDRDLKLDPHGKPPQWATVKTKFESLFQRLAGEHLPLAEQEAAKAALAEKSVGSTTFVVEVGTRNRLIAGIKTFFNATDAEIFPASQAPQRAAQSGVQQQSNAEQNSSVAVPIEPMADASSSGGAPTFVLANAKGESITAGDVHVDANMRTLITTGAKNDQPNVVDARSVAGVDVKKDDKSSGEIALRSLRSEGDIALEFSGSNSAEPQKVSIGFLQARNLDLSLLMGGGVTPQAKTHQQLHAEQCAADHALRLACDRLKRATPMQIVQAQAEMAAALKALSAINEQIAKVL